VACVVKIGRIEEIDAGIERGVNHTLRSRRVDAPSKIVAAEAYQRDF
jgi:hypothetical protein